MEMFKYVDKNVLSALTFILGVKEFFSHNVFTV